MRDAHRLPPGQVFNGRAGVIIEVAPGHWVTYRLHRIDGTVDLERQTPEPIRLEDWYEPLRQAPTAWRARIMIEGDVMSEPEPCARPDWATDTPAIGPRGKLPAAPPLRITTRPHTEGP